MLSKQYKVIDVDTHVVEPYDLWTARMSREKFGDLVPHVKRDPESGTDHWHFGGKEIMSSAAAAAMAGWNDYPPNFPKSLSEVSPRTYDPAERLKVMDEYGIHAQVMFPNLIFFCAGDLLRSNNHELMLETVKVYNDWQSDYASIAPDRLLPQTVLPFWDLELSIQEMERCVKKGHRGIVITSEPSYFDQPKLTNPYWDRLWAAAEGLGLPVNFHIGSGDLVSHLVMDASVRKHAEYASRGVLFFMSNVSAITQIICGGICHRFPKLNFVSVESGVGWLPFALDCLDWQWKNCGVARENPEYKLLPSEYFKRQIYGAFWFERDSLAPAIASLGADNILYETDYPHPTSMSPGPATTAQIPSDYLEQAFQGIAREDAGKILHSNAARIYHLN